MKTINKKLVGLSLFASAGIGETFFPELGIDVLVANELLPKRAALYQSIAPQTKVICGDISDSAIFDEVMNSLPDKIDFLLASPPCQGMSVAGKNRNQTTMKADKRNYLITYAINAIKCKNPDYALIENVPALLKIILKHNNKFMSILDILKEEFSDQYNIDGKVVDSSDYCVPQVRKRAIIKLYKHGKIWPWPTKCQTKVTVADTIGHLPSLEAGEKSNIKWHFARNHSPENILCMKHTPTGCSAFQNPVHYPRKADGSKVRGYQSSYRRIKWDAPAPTITIRNDCIASQRNVHPGRIRPDGTYSDARVLTPLELMLLNSLPQNWNIPDDTPEILIRQCIGESIPPLMLKAIVQGIFNSEK